MFGRKKKPKTMTCPGCQGELTSDDEDCIIFDLMRIRHSTDDVAGNPQEIRESASFVIALHQKCLGNIWVVNKYVENVSNFSDVEVTVNINNSKMKYQVRPAENRNSWEFRADIEGGFMQDFQGTYPNKDIDKILKRMLDKGDIRFAVLEQDNILSVPILFSVDNPLINSLVTSKEEKDIAVVAKEEYEQKYRELMAINKNAKIMLIEARIEYAYKIGLKLKL